VAGQPKKKFDLFGLVKLPNPRPGVRKGGGGSWVVLGQEPTITAFGCVEAIFVTGPNESVINRVVESYV
jgi:hypothetical protein